MKQYNYETTGATFCEIDYEKRMPNGHQIDVVYTDGVSYVRSIGWADSRGEAKELIAKRASMFGVDIISVERVA